MCEECNLQVSDKAISCPHCGYPIQLNVKTRKSVNKKNKRRRLPNGFGQISEIKNQNLRNPFRAMVTVGKDSNGRPICRPLKPKSYFPTYNDAYAALIEHNKNPYDLNPSITIKELYEKWSEEHFKKMKSENGIRSVISAWSYCTPLYNTKVTDIRARHIKGCIEDGKAIVRGVERKATPVIKTRIKSLFNLMLDYAVEYEIVDRNYARTFKISEDIIKEEEKRRTGHMPFSEEEMQLLWEHIKDVPYVNVLIIQCYSGWRPQELGLIKLKNVNLNDWTFIGGMKTEAGTDRIVPIHSKIRPLVKKLYDDAIVMKSEYLINYTEEHRRLKNPIMTYNRYQKCFYRIRDKLKLNPQHKPHDARMHFITNAKKFCVDEYAIKYIVGHSINDLTEKVYTKREIDWFKREIEKIK